MGRSRAQSILFSNACPTISRRIVCSHARDSTGLACMGESIRASPRSSAEPLLGSPLAVYRSIFSQHCSMSAIRSSGLRDKDRLLLDRRGRSSGRTMAGVPRSTGRPSRSSSWEDFRIEEVVERGPDLERDKDIHVASLAVIPPASSRRRLVTSPRTSGAGGGPGLQPLEMARFMVNGSLLDLEPRLA